jgi:hypothetical protein
MSETDGKSPAEVERIAIAAHDLHAASFKLAQTAGFSALRTTASYSQLSWQVPLAEGTLSIATQGDGISQKPSFDQSPLVWADLALVTNNGYVGSYYLGTWYVGKAAIIGDCDGDEQHGSLHVPDLLDVAEVNSAREMVDLVICSMPKSVESTYSRFVWIGGVASNDLGSSLFSESSVIGRSGNQSTKLEIEFSGGELDPVSFRASMTENQQSGLRLTNSSYIVNREKTTGNSRDYSGDGSGVDNKLCVGDLEKIKRRGYVLLGNVASSIGK